VAAWKRRAVGNADARIELGMLPAPLDVGPAADFREGIARAFLGPAGKADALVAPGLQCVQQLVHGLDEIAGDGIELVVRRDEVGEDEMPTVLFEDRDVLVAMVADGDNAGGALQQRGVG